MSAALPLSDNKEKSSSAFRTIGEVATDLALPPHVLRFWESKFNQVKPHKRRGGHRYYRPTDIELLREIKSLLYDRGYTIKGAQKYLKDLKKETAQTSLFAKDNAGSANKDTNHLKKVLSELLELKEILKQY